MTEARGEATLVLDAAEETVDAEASVVPVTVEATLLRDEDRFGPLCVVGVLGFDGRSRSASDGRGPWGSDLLALIWK